MKTKKKNPNKHEPEISILNYKPHQTPDGVRVSTIVPLMIILTSLTFEGSVCRSVRSQTLITAVCGVCLCVCVCVLVFVTFTNLSVICITKLSGFGRELNGHLLCIMK